MSLFSKLLKDRYSGKQFTHNGIYVCSKITEMFQDAQLSPSPNNPETGELEQTDIVTSMYLNINEMAIKEMIVDASPYLKEAFIFHRQGDTTSSLLNISDAIVCFEGWKNHVIPDANFSEQYDLLIELHFQLLTIINKVNDKKAVFTNE